MSDAIIKERPAIPKVDEWAERIAAQQGSGISVKQFCKEQGVTEVSFYLRLAQTAPEKGAGTFRFGG
jgi:hypothetical protein